jgi:tRNA G18 (ribose-2'-O)-methylase SpoU
MDTRNVTDFYKYWETEAIIADLDTKRHNFSILCANIQGDFNIGTVVRNANAFLAKEVIIYGKRKFDPRGTVGCHHYTHFQHVNELDDISVLKTSETYIIGVDNIDGAEAIDDIQLPTDKHIIFAFGEENSGLTPEMLAICDSLVYIKQFGSVRSLNVGSASAIIMYEYCRRL